VKEHKNISSIRCNISEKLWNFRFAIYKSLLNNFNFISILVQGRNACLRYIGWSPKEESVDDSAKPAKIERKMDEYYFVMYISLLYYLFCVHL
jgi:hypothetical protein